MKRLILISSFLLSGLFVSTSFACVETTKVTLFGPNKYVRTKGQPNVYTDSFPGIPGKGKLIVRNGDEYDHKRGKHLHKDNHRHKDYDHRVSSATILINGKQILGPKDFNKNIDEMRVPVHLKEHNSISIKLRSKPGSYLKVEVKQEVQADAAAVIGPQGGSMQSKEGFSIDIPPGALSQPVVFVLNQMAV